MRHLPRMIGVMAALGCATTAVAQDSGIEDVTQNGIDWSVALRGSYASNTLTGGRAGLVLAPEASLVLGGQSSLSTLSAGSELVVDNAGQARISDLHAGAGSQLQLDAHTILDGSIDATLSQLHPDDSSLPANTLTAPLAFSAKAEGSATRDFDRINVKATLEGERSITGETVLDDLSTIDNSHQSYWEGGATLRAGYEITPLIGAFVEGEVSAQKFDAPSPTLLTYLDARTYQLRAGLSYAQGSVISAEASIGHAWLDYFDGSLTDAPSWVYNASLSVRPDETLELVGSLETTLGPSASVAGDTDVTYRATGTARYDVNPVLMLRGSAGWDQTVVLGTGDVSWGFDAGAGLDYRSSRHITWTADYLFQRDAAPPAPLNDTHTVTVGVRVER